MSKNKVIYKETAAISIYKFGIYIHQNGYPITADEFINKLYDFGNSLFHFPKKYPLCRKISWAKRDLRCATFHKNYIFVYQILEGKIIIYNVIHAHSIT